MATERENYLIIFPVQSGQYNFKGMLPKWSPLETAKQYSSPAELWLPWQRKEKSSKNL